MKLSEKQRGVRYAIEEGIRKWRRLKESERALYFGVEWCSLCIIFVEGIALSCRACPLDKIGKHCLDEGGYFKKFAKNDADNKYRRYRTDAIKRWTYLFLKDLEGELKTETEKLINGMISDLNEALAWFDRGGKDEY